MNRDCVIEAIKSLVSRIMGGRGQGKGQNKGFGGKRTWD